MYGDTKMMTTEEAPVTTMEQQLLDGEELQAIADPRERLQRAAEVAAQADKLADEHRAARNSAALQMFRDEDVPAVEVWDRTLGISRTLWTRVVNDPDVVAGEYSDPRATAAAEADSTRLYEKLAKDAKVVRNSTARELMSGRHGPAVSNAEVARLSGLTTARVAQLRTSY